MFVNDGILYNLFNKYLNHYIDVFIFIKTQKRIATIYTVTLFWALI